MAAYSDPCSGFVYCCGAGSFGGTNLSMATSTPNPATPQSGCCASGDGGAGALSNVLNTVGKWGTAITGVVAGSKVQAATVQAKATTKVATAGISSVTMIVVVIVVALLIYMVAK